MSPLALEAGPNAGSPRGRKYGVRVKGMLLRSIVTVLEVHTLYNERTPSHIHKS